MSLSSGTDSTSSAIISSLQSASAKLHAARITASLFTATERAISIGSGFVLGSGVLAICGVIGLLPKNLGGLCLAATLACMFAFIVSKVVATSKARPGLAETSERLDLAVNGHNQIATSYELSRKAQLSYFSRRALADGLSLLESVKESQPVMPARSFQPSTFSKLFLPVGLLLFVATIVLPSGVKNVAKLLTLSLPSTRVTLAQPLNMYLKPDAAKKPDTSQPLLAANLSQQKSSHPAAGQTQLQKNGRSQSNSASLASAGQQISSFAGTAESKLHPDDPNATSSHSISPDSKQPGAPVSSSSRANASSDSAAPDTSAGQPVMGSLSGNGSGDSAKSPPGNSGSGSGSEADSKSDQGQGGKGNGGKSQGKGSGSGEADGEPTSNGKGKGTGQNSLKKSRGVAPEYLGGLDPDTLTGPKLPGPDQRTPEQVSPLHGADAPAPDAPAADRPGPEAPVTHYDVPADSRSIVSDYFKALHDRTPN